MPYYRQKVLILTCIFDYELDAKTAWISLLGLHR